MNNVGKNITSRVNAAGSHHKWFYLQWPEQKINEAPFYGSVPLKMHQIFMLALAGLR
jgi:hypothetical protein